MFKKLHYQLTFFCTFITGFILVILSTACFFIARNSLLEKETISFQNNINSIFSYLENQEIITHQWIRQAQSNYQLSLLIYDGGVPLASHALPTWEEEELPLEKALEMARRDYGLELLLPTTNRLPVHEEFSLTDKHGETWTISAAILPKNGKQLGVLVLHSLKIQKHQLAKTALLFCLADLMALVFLGLFSWFFTLRMLTPMEASQKSQHIFIASASHELRSPLTAILSAATALEKAPPSQVPHFTSMIKKESSRMSALVGDMLTLANSDAKALNIHCRREQLEGILLDTYEKYELLSKARHFHLEMHLPQELLPDCFCDRTRMEQILTILMDNALRYVPENGRISLELCQKNNSLEIRVADNGPGIPREEREKIFERFYRGDSARTDKNHYGLGLCIAKELVLAQRGALLVEDTPGGGATFLVQLPLL